MKRANLSQEQVTLLFNRSVGDLDNGPFQAKLTINERKTRKIFTWQDDKFHIPESINFSLTNLSRPERYEVTFELDGCIAYRNAYIAKDNEILF